MKTPRNLNLKPFYGRKMGLLLFLYLGFIQAQTITSTHIIINGGTDVQSGHLAPAADGVEAVEGTNTVIIGQPFVGGTMSGNYKTNLGFWTPRLQRPGPAILIASYDIYPDQIDLEWSYDPNTPPPTIKHKVYRDDAFINNSSIEDTTFQDQGNLNTGTEYTYTLKGQNSFGLCENPAIAVGKTSTVGSISGNISTALGTKIPNAKVKLTPNWGGSVYLDGADDYITIPDGDEFEFSDNTILPNATLDLWIYPTGSIQDATLLSKGSAWAVGLSTSGSFQYLVYKVNSTNVIISDDVIAVGEWTHVSIVKTTISSNTTVQLFLNGSLASINNNGSTTATQSHGAGNSNSFLVGKDNSGNFFRGNVDDLRTWNSTISAEDIARNFEQYIFYQTLGVVNYPNLTSVFQMDNGSGTTITNGVDQTKNGVVTTDGGWSSLKPPVFAIDYTDDNGNYQINNVNYGNGTNFLVTPTKESHVFSPSSTNITLLDQTPVASNVDFSVTNLMSISGFVTFNTSYTGGNECGEKDVQIWVNGEFSGVLTNDNGYYLIEAEPGSDKTISAYRVDRGDEDFSPSTYSYTNIITPKTGNFVDHFTRTLSGVVGGGSCQFPLGPATMSTVIATAPGCFSDTVNVNASGNYVFEELPPLEYEISVDVDVTIGEVSNITGINDHFQNSGVSHNMADAFDHTNGTWKTDVDSVDGDINNGYLLDNGDTLDFIYFADLSVEFVDNLTTTNHAGDQMFNWGEPDTVDIFVFEPYYNGNKCPLDTGSVEIEDYIGDIYPTNSVNIDISLSDSGHVFYTISPGIPKLPSDEDNFDFDQIKKQFAVSVSDTSGTRTADLQDYAAVMGHVPLSMDFTTITDKMPLMILRRPPGDLSYSTWTTTGTQSTALSSYTESVAGFQIGLTHKVGVVSTVVTAPMGIGTAHEVGSQTTYSGTFTNTNTITSENEVVMTTSTSTSLSTSTDVVGISGNAYWGAAINILYGTVKTLDFKLNDDSDWVYDVGTEIIVVPDGFATTFFYSQDHIENDLIVDLQELVDYYTELAGISTGTLKIAYEDSAADYSAAVTNWLNVLDREEELTEDALLDAENYSFDASTGEMTITTTNTNSTTQTWSKAFQFEAEFINGLEGKVFGYDVDIERGVFGSFTFGGSESSTSESTTEITFTLDDDDDPDVYTVDVGYDSTYGTPVFQVVSGVSSCPYEEWYNAEGEVSTTPADEPTMEWISASTANNVLPDDVAEFIVKLRNDSPSQDTRTYELSFVGASNPLGAVWSINGAQDVISFELVYLEEVEALVTVQRPEGSNEYDFDDLRIKFAPPCETNYAGVTEGYTLPFSVHFARPCSNVDIYEPNDDFVVNTSYDDTLYFILTNYEMNQSYFNSIELQYRPLGDQTWYTFTEIDTIQEILQNGQDVIVALWDLINLEDGIYDVRAKSICLDDLLTTAMQPITGIVDRIKPASLGAPEPTDGVLNMGDEVAVNFTENINPITLTPLDVTIMDPIIGEITALDVDVSESRAVITLQVPNFTIENHILSAKIKNYEDMYANQGDSIMWSFQVNRNPITWNQSEMNVISFTGEENSFATELHNIGSSAQNFEITELPEWLSASPAQGEINPGGSFEIEFEVDPYMNAGEYNQTLFADCPEGMEPLTIDMIAMCPYPEWEINPFDYEYTMTVTAQLSVLGTVSEDIYDRVGAFINGELRGVADLVYDETMENYLVYLTIYNNVYTGQDVEFHIWDRTGCVEFWGMDTSLVFTGDTYVGSPMDPLLINANGAIAQNIGIESGFTWISLNLESDVSDNLNAAFAGFTLNDGDRIIGQTSFAQYQGSTSNWVGELTGLEIGQMYMTDLDSSNQLDYIGFPVIPDTVSLFMNDNWTWLGYLPHENMHVNAALASLDATPDDLLKDQFNFAQFVADIGWVGSLTRMFPDRGYKLFMETGDTLVYPNHENGRGNSVAPTEFELANIFDLDSLPPSPWILENVHEFQHSMTITALIESDTFGINDPYDMIVALVDDEVRGVARPLYIPQMDEYRIFMTVYSNEANDETIEFRIWDNDAERIMKGAELVYFTPDDRMGTVTQPLMIAMTSLSVFDDGFIPEEFMLSQNYPNPFNPITKIGIGVPEVAKVRVTIFDIMGRQVKTLMNHDMQPGYQFVVWNGTNQFSEHVSSGIYFVVMEGKGATDNFRDVKKMMMLK